MPDFRITYVNRGASIEGNDPTAPMLRSAMKALENVPSMPPPISPASLFASTISTRPRRDCASWSTASRSRFEHKPQVVAVLKQMVNGLIEVDADHAAEAYVEEMAAVMPWRQNTGMKRGDVRRTSRAVDNPLGGAAVLKSSAVRTD